jgi:hypothetical protein
MCVYLPHVGLYLPQVGLPTSCYSPTACRYPYCVRKYLPHSRMLTACRVHIRCVGTSTSDRLRQDFKYHMSVYILHVGMLPTDRNTYYPCSFIGQFRHVRIYCRCSNFNLNRLSVDRAIHSHWAPTLRQVTCCRHVCCRFQCDCRIDRTTYSRKQDLLYR